MDDFNTIIIQTRCKIALVSGDRPSFRIDEDREKSRWINISIVDNQLVVYTKPQYYGYLLRHGYYPQITITYNTLIALKMLDRCVVRSGETLNLQNLGIVVTEGYLDVSVDAYLIDCTMLKRGYAKLSGETIISRVLTHGRSVYNGMDLEASVGNVHTHDGSLASVWFIEELEFGLFGRSELNYRGAPRMKIWQIEERCKLKQIDASDNIEIKI